MLKVVIEIGAINLVEVNGGTVYMCCLTYIYIYI